jgi:hypothetical protein
LPVEVQERARESYRKFQDSPEASGLRLKIVASNPTVYSIRIGRTHRALGIRRGDTMVWFWIGDHKEYEQVLDELR